MKFNIKAILSAVVLSLSATAANAYVDVNSGNSEFFFNAWDVSTGTGYTYDLNWSGLLEDLIGGDLASTTSTNAATVAANANNALLVNQAQHSTIAVGANGIIFDSVLTGLPFTTASNVQWNLSAIDQTGRTRLVTTKDVTDASAVTTSSNQSKTAVTAVAGFLPANGALVADANALLDDTYVVTNDTNGAGYAGVFGATWNNNAFDTTNILGTSSSLYMLAQSTTGNASASIKALYTQIGVGANSSPITASTYLAQDGWHLQLSVAAVPEPETYAMLVAGLGLMGFSARRRSN